MESSRCLKLLKSAATDSGVKYELKISALLFIRAQKKGLNFEMFRNVETALPFDDVVIRVLNGNDSRLFFVQLKHGEEKGKTVSLQSFCPRERDGPKIETGDFNLRKYYTLSEKLYRIHNRQGKPPTEDEEILMETPLDKVWFIIYTNKIIQQAPKDTDQSEDTKMMNDLFETSSSGSSIRFNESQKNIWNQMDKDESKKRIYKEIFLPHLKIFHGQIHVDDLDAQILLEIKSIIGSPLPKESQNNILENFLEKIEEWTKETSGISLCHYDRILEQAVTQELRRRIQEALTLLEFKDEHLKETEKLLQELDQKAKKEKNLVRSQMCIRQILPGLRASKILQVMKKNDCYRNSWIYVDDWLLENYSFEAITLSLRVIDFLIIDLSQEKIYEQQTLLKTAKEFPICVVELTNEDKAELAEDWTLEHLTTEYQYKLLQRPINFQGQEIKLGHLEETWPSLRNHVSGIELNDLVSGKLIEVGAALPDLDYLYIERKIQHTRSRRVNSSIWNIRSVKDRFILKNFSEEILQDLRKSDSPWEECDIFWKPLSENKSSKSTSSDKSEESVKSQLIRTKWTVEEGKQQVNLRSKENVHWLTMKEGEIVWEKSHRKFNIIKEHSKGNKRCLSLKTGNCVHDDAKDFLNWTDKCIILADAPGKGKSTFITHIARETKLQHKSNWVIVIRLNDGYILEKLPKQVDMIGNAEVLDIFFNTVFFPGREEPLNWKHFLAAAFQETGFINVFIDGVDEVCPAYKSRAIRLLETIKRTMEKSGGKIWVATRPVLEDDLKHVLNCRTPLSLLPYSRNDQVKYILWRWKDTLMDVSQVERERRVAYFVDTVRTATSTVRGATSSKETFSLSDLPLYTKMLAEVYLGSEFYTDENLPKKLSRLNLYRSFVEKTIEGMWEKDGLTEGKRENLNISCDEILAKHKNYAAVVCFDEDGKILTEFPFLEHAMQQITTSNQIEKQARPGLISSIVNGKPSFVHFTILEFLGSWWLFDEWCRDSNKVHLITEKLYTEKYSVCRYFFDAFLAKGKTIHEMLLGGRLAELHLQFTYHQEPNDDKRTYEHIQNKRTVTANEKDAGGRRPLHLAVIMEDLSAVKILVQAGADLNAEDEVLKWTPLRYADHMFRKGPGGRTLLEVIDLLLERGANSSHIPNISKDNNAYKDIIERHHPNIILAMLNENISQFLKFLVKSNYLEKCVIDDTCFIVDTLLKNKEFLQHLTGPYKNLTTRLLFTAIENNVVGACQVLVENGLDVNVSQHEECTPLMLAAKKGYNKICHILLSKNANVNAKNREGNTALMLAAKRGYENICHLLIENGAYVNEVNKIGYSPLLFASDAGNEGVCRILIENKADIDVIDRNKNTPLYIAVVRRHENVCRLLIDGGADIDQKCIGKWFKDQEKNKIHFAADFGSANFCECCIQKGTDVNIKDKQGRTPLMFAALKGHLKTTTVLLSHGADVNSRDKKGWTSLMMAAMEGHESLCSILIQNGANVKITNKDGNSALTLSAQSGHNNICLMLLNKGAEINKSTKDKATPLILSVQPSHETVIRTLVYYHADVNAKDHKNYTALHIASAKGLEEAVRILLVNGASVNATNKIGESPLHCAAASGHEGVCRCLVTFGAETNARNNSGDMPIHLAARFGHEAVCRVLIANGAHTDVKNKFNSTPMDEAFANKHGGLYDILEKYVDHESSCERAKIG